ncbi:MAG: hypothetical protein AAFY26_16245 [Cyanobacteria bacterium J06638_22]
MSWKDGQQRAIASPTKPQPNPPFRNALTHYATHHTRQTHSSASIRVHLRSILPTQAHYNTTYTIKRSPSSASIRVHLRPIPPIQPLHITP